MLSGELRQRLAKEYRYAATKMQEVAQPTKKLYYFSVFYTETQRLLNLEWDRDLVLIYTVAHHVYTQINTTLQTPGSVVLPIDWATVIEKLTQYASGLATYYEKTEDDNSRQEMYQTLGHLAEIAYAVSGNGSYLYEKGSFKL
jgi:hypothetical protein